jgi:hypothetical protein
VPKPRLDDLHVQTGRTGLGRLLGRDAILSTLAAADHIGVRILLVHALHEPVATFYEKLGFKHSPTDPLHLYLLLADAPPPNDQARTGRSTRSWSGATRRQNAASW